MAEEPLDGLAVGFVTELASQLENTGGANDRHAYSPAAAIDLAVAVLGGRLLDDQRAITRRLLSLGVNNSAVGDAVSSTVRIRHVSTRLNLVKIKALGLVEVVKRVLERD